MRCPKCQHENPEDSTFCGKCGTQVDEVAQPSFTKTLESPVEIPQGTIFAGKYEILEKLGRGGMGEVYRALDKNLGRQVAIKVLPEEFSEDKERMARFEREAKLLAVLNHPNIASIYGLEKSEGRRFLVLELVEGETLSTRLDQGSLPVEEALETCLQIAEGLEVAHEKGIVHRDLKPGNIMITPEGSIKILDFGLAKAYAVETTDIDIEKSPTITAQMTEPGVIMGTAAYMSPEQARSRRVDKKADIWAFGCVLYECLTGKRTFHGETVSDTLAHILKGEPDWAALPSNVSTPIRTLLRRCLQKDPKKRLHDIADARIEIIEQQEAGLPSAEERSGIRRLPLVWMLAGGTILLAVGMLIEHLVLKSSKPAPSTFPLTSVIKLEPGYGLAGSRYGGAFNRPTRTAMVLSHDGTFMVYCAIDDSAGPEARRQLLMRRLDELDASPIVGTEGGMAPFLSPDDQWIGFWADGWLKKVPVDGGVAQDLCEVRRSFGASWSDDGKIVFGSDEASGLSCVSSQGGQPEVLTEPDREREEYGHRLPFYLPNGKGVLFTVASHGFDIEPNIAILDIATRKWRVLLKNASDARYIPSGHVVFMRRGTLMAVPFDLAKLDIQVQPVSIIRDVLHTINIFDSSLHTAAGQYSLSDSGILAYAPGEINPDRQNTLIWVDRDGKERPASSRLEPFFAPHLSTDGKKVAYTTQGIEKQIRILDIGRDITTPLISKGFSIWSIWTPTPDAQKIAFGWNRITPPHNIYMISADGSTAMERLTNSQNAQYPASFSPDGNRLAFVESNKDFDISIYDLQNKSITPFRATDSREMWPAFSPDGRWIAYSSNDEGRFEVYVGASSGTGETIRVTYEGGTQPLWARSGEELFYRTVTSGLTKVWAVNIQAGPSLTPGKPSLLFEKVGLGFGYPICSWDISRDDREFLIVKLEEREPRPVTEMILIQNWFAELKRLVPVEK